MKYYDSKDLKLIDDFKDYSPELFGAYISWSDKIFCEGALPKKVKELIAVAVAHTVQCPYCIDVHTKIAEGCGATKEELAEAIHAASAIKGGAALFHSIQAVKVLEGED
jgi:alkylhydroperoxidase/carboxymuconolactone decarboxylase family protein